MGNELVVKGDDISALASNDSSWIAGLEQDLIRPKFARLYGSASQALVKGSDKYFEGLKAGDYAIGSDHTILGEKMRIVVCGTKKDFVELTEKPPVGKFVARHTPQEFEAIKVVLEQDKENPGRWYSGDGQCFVETYTLFFLELDHLEIGGLCMSFTSSGIKSWREIVSRTASAKVKDETGKIVSLAPWAVVWNIGSKIEPGKKGGNPYLLPSIDGNFSILDRTLWDLAKGAFEQVDTALKSGRVSIETASEE